VWLGVPVSVPVPDSDPLQLCVWLAVRVELGVAEVLGVWEAEAVAVWLPEPLCDCVPVREGVRLVDCERVAV
jgi:hypothetical protein